MKKRLIDIYPPHSKKATLEQEELPFEVAQGNAFSQAPKTLGNGIFLLLLFFVFVAPPLFSHLFFAKATIEVWPRITKLHVEEQIGAQTGYDKVSLEKGIIRARVFEEEQAQAQIFPVSGKAFKERRARGSIRVYNENSTQPEMLVADTRFISQDGTLFRLDSAATIPGGKMDGRKLVPGFIDVQVTAAEPGATYNIGPSHFSLPGLVGSSLYTKVYAESFQAMSGGAEHEVLVVTENDIAVAKDQLVETLKTQAVKSMLARVPPQFEMLPDSIKFTVVEDNSLIKPGAELEEFTYSAKINLSMVGFHKGDADVLARHLLSRRLTSNQTVNDETLQITYTASKISGTNGFTPITVQMTADQYEKVDTTNLTRRLAGVPADEFRRVAEEYPFLARARFSLWPFWTNRIPQDPRRVDIDVNPNLW